MLRTEILCIGNNNINFLHKKRTRIFYWRSHCNSWQWISAKLYEEIRYIHAQLEWKGFHTLKNTKMAATYSINKQINLYIYIYMAFILCVPYCRPLPVGYIIAWNLTDWPSRLSPKCRTEVVPFLLSWIRSPVAKEIPLQYQRMYQIPNGQ